MSSYDPIRTETVDLAADRSGLSRPERFVLDMADLLLANSPERAESIQVERSFYESGYETLTVYSPGPRWFNHAISIRAAKPGKSDIINTAPRWGMYGASVIGKVAGRNVKAETYSDTRILVDVYGR